MKPELTPEEVRKVEQWMMIEAFPQSYYHASALASREIIEIVEKLCDRYWATLNMPPVVPDPLK
jgi:hypothetical protein